MIGLKKGMSYLLCAAMVLTMGPVSSFAGEVAQESETVTFIDMPDGWARAGLEHGVANGLLKGYRTAAGFEIRPAGKITRAELVTAVNRAFGAIETASLDGVTDVDPDVWYATEIAEAVAMRTMTKAEKMRPNDKVTRQEAFTILARAYEIGGGTRADLAGFKDADSVAEYAVDSLGALVKAGYVSGSEGKLNPTGDMTRAEFAKIMDNLTAVYVHDGGEYSDDVTGNVIVNTGGACLKDMNIDGDLIVAEGVGEGDADLVNLNVTGDIIVKAGGDHSIRFDGVNARYLIIDKELGNTPVRTALSGKMSVKEVFVKSDAIIDTANADKSSDLGTVLISGEAVKNLKLNGWFNTVENLAADLKLTATGTIEKLTAEVKTEVAGGAEIKEVSNRSGSDIKVNDKVVQSENKPEGTTEGGNKTDAVNNGGSSGGSSGGSRNGGGSGNSDAPKLTDEQKIAADKAKIEKSSIRISVPYKTEKDSVKAMLTEKVNGLSGLYNKTWEADTFEKFNSTLYDTEQTVDISFKLGETVTEIVKAVVYVEPMTVADKRAADKSRLESLTAPPAVSVGYYAFSSDVEKAIEDFVNNDTEYFCSDWRVTEISVFFTRMAGQQSVTVKLTSGEVTTEKVQFSVTTLPMTDNEKREEDKALLESDRTEISANVAYSATASDAKAALALNVNATSGLYFTDWEVAEMTGFEENGTGEQTVSVILKSGNVRTAAVSAKVTVAGITAAESLPLEKARLEAFTETEVNVGFTDTEEQVKDKLCRKIVKNLSGFGWTFMNTWQADTLSGFERGVAGTQNVTFTLKSGETVTDSITAEVVVPEPTDEEYLALQKDLIEAAASDLSFTVDERARLDDLEGIIESKIQEINSIWSAYRIDGFTAGSGGDQNVTVHLSAVKGDNYITTTIVVKVTVTVLPVEEKLASDKAKIESALAGKDFSLESPSSYPNLSTAIEYRIGNEPGMWYGNEWNVVEEDIENLDYDTAQTQSVSVKLRIEKGDAVVTTDAISITLTIVEPSSEDKANKDISKIDELSYYSIICAEVAYGADADTVKAALEASINQILGLNFHDWRVTGLGDYDTTDEDDEQIISNCTIASDAGNTTGTVRLRIMVGAKPESVKMDEDKVKLEAAGTAMTLAGEEALENDATEADAKAALAAKANGVSGLNYTDWAAGTLTGFSAGTSGTHNVTITFTRGNVTTSPIAVSVTVKNASIEAKIAADAEKLGKHDGNYKYEMAESLAVTMDSADATESQVMAAIQEKVNSLNSLQYHDWTVEAPGSEYNGSGYKQGRGGTQTVSAFFKAGTTSVHVYGIPVTCPEIPDSAKLAYDKAEIEGYEYWRISSPSGEDDAKGRLKDELYEMNLFFTDEWQVASMSGYRELNDRDDSYNLTVTFSCRGVTTSPISVGVFNDW